MNITEAIHSRRAVRSFTDEPIDEAVIHAILEAGRRAQSSKNWQPWQFVVIRERATLQTLATMGDYAGHLAGAALGVVMVTADGGYRAAFDLGQAAAQMQLAAWEFGVGSCLATIYRQEATQALLGIPAEMDVSRALSFGYPSPDHQPAKLGGRKPLADVVRWERWG